MCLLHVIYTSSNFQHRVPILLQHHASNASSPAQQRHQSPPTQTELTGNILTHVDIQHVGNPSMPVSGKPLCVLIELSHDISWV